MHFWHYDLINYWFGGQKFCYFEVMNEELVTLVIKGEVEVDKFVDVQILQSG